MRTAVSHCASEDPEGLKEQVVPVPGVPGVYKVTVYKNGSERHVILNTRVPVTKNGKAFHNAKPTDGMYGPLIEKAVIMLNKKDGQAVGDYSDTPIVSSPTGARQLNGTHESYFTWSGKGVKGVANEHEGKASFEHSKQQLDRDDVIVTASVGKNTQTSAGTLPGPHAYTVLNLIEKGEPGDEDATYVLINNPHGYERKDNDGITLNEKLGARNGDTFALSFEEFKEYFRAYRTIPLRK